MKAKEYAEKFIQTARSGVDNSFSVAVCDMYKGMFFEVGEISTARKTRSNEGVIAVFEEMQKKWEAACRIINAEIKDAVVNSEGFILLAEKEMKTKLRRLPE